jgi:hypothetical protein
VNIANWSIPPQYIVIVMSFAMLAFVILCTVIVIGMFKRPRFKAAGWLGKMGFSLEASDRDDPPDKD